MTPAERFWAKVDKTDDCWEWTASLNNRGYGLIGIDGQLHLAHRISYTWAKGQISDGLQIDHLCSNRRCVNPDHLEAVTPVENVRRSSGCRATEGACANGHPWDGNEFYTKAGWRRCRTCHRDAARERARRLYIPVSARQQIAS